MQLHNYYNHYMKVITIHTYDYVTLVNSQDKINNFEAIY